MRNRLSLSNQIQYFCFVVCKSCLVKHLEDNNHCPKCNSIIHQSHPLQYISFDRTMQDIVFKLVPNLQDGELNAMYSYRPNFESFFCHLLEEMNRERDFYRARNLPCPKDVPMVQENDDVEKKLNEAHQESDYHRQDEQVTLCLECKSNSLKNLNRKFLRCSSQATITHLKKFIAKKVLNGIEKHKEVSDKHF